MKTPTPRRPAQNAAKPPPHRSPTARGPKATKDTPPPQNRPDGDLRRHPPIGDRDREILALCEARRLELGISIHETGRRAGVDCADASRALALKAATSRTVLRLARFFEVSEIEGVNREVRIQAALIELQANAERQAKLLSNLAHLRAFDPPGV